MYLSIPRKGVFHELVRTFLGQMWLKVLFGNRSGTPAHDNSLSTLIEDLSDTSEQCALVEALVKADSHVADRELRAFSGKAPRYALSLVVESSVDVPSPGRFVLELSFPTNLRVPPAL